MDKAAVAALAQEELQLTNPLTEGQVSRAAYVVGYTFEYDRPVSVEPGDAALAARFEVLQTRVQELEARISDAAERNKAELGAMTAKLREYDGVRIILEGLRRDVKNLQGRSEVVVPPRAAPPASGPGTTP